MVNDWQTVRLGKFLTERKEFVTIDDFTRYKRARVQLHGKGIVIRDVVQGVEIKTKSQQVAHTGEFLVAEIDAKVGGFGIVPPELDGAIVSGHYFLFEIDEQICLRHWLDWFIRWGALEEQVTARGSTNYAAIRPNDVVEFTIPLSPLAEQQCIVARVDTLARRVEEACGLRRAAVEEAEAIITSALHEIFVTKTGNWNKMPMPEAIAINDRQVDPTLPQYSSLPHISGENIQSKTCKLLPYRTAEQDEVKSSNYLFSPNSILYSKIRPYLQKAVFVHFQGVCSADIYPIKVTSTQLEPRFVMWSLVANPFTEYANRLSGRTRMPKLNRKQLFAFELAYPPLANQRRIVVYLDGLQAKVDELRHLQAATRKELDALMPSILAKAFAGEL